MRGWTPDGKEIGLSPGEEQAVRALLSWGAGRAVTLHPAEDGSKAVVMATVARIGAGERPSGPSPSEAAEFRRSLILAMNDPDVERAVHQAVARRQAVKAKGRAAAAGKPAAVPAERPELRSVGS